MTQIDVVFSETVDIGDALMITNKRGVWVAERTTPPAMILHQPRGVAIAAFMQGEHGVWDARTGRVTKRGDNE